MEGNGGLLSRVRRTMCERGLADASSCVLLMVSGGSDSTALAYLASGLAQAGEIGALGMLHVNHRIRGEAADADQAFVESLAAVLAVPLTVRTLDIPAEVARTGENIEALGRRRRYEAADEALEGLCRATATPRAQGRVFTAHTADDRVENFYMRSIVGTGPGGFRSMRYVNGQVARPLLDVGHEELRAYIRCRAQAGLAVARNREGALWCEDATNAETERFRAFVRQGLVPLAKQRNPRLLETLGRTMNLIADEDEMLEAQAAQIEERCVRPAGPDGTQAPSGTQDCGRAPGRVFMPEFAQAALPLQRRVAVRVLRSLLGPDERVEDAAVEAVLAGFSAGRPVSGYVANIQGDLAVSANKHGVLVEPMPTFRARRKRL